MMTLSEKVAYLKGLAEGSKVDESTKEGKLIVSMIDVLEDMALSVADVQDTVSEMALQVDEIDDDLAAIEDEWYDDDYEEEDDDEEYLDDGPIYEVECPVCGDVICVDEDLLDEGAIECPNCGETLEFDFDECDCGEDCHCDGSCSCESDK